MRGVPVAESPVGAFWDRVVALILVGVGGLLVFLLLQITPDGRGHGTHEQLGMQPCGWPMAWDIPCPTCGVTTAACHLVHLSPLRSIQTQPFGAALAAFGLWAAVYAAFCLVTRRSFMDRIVRLPYGTMATGAIVLFLAAWAYKYFTFTP